MYDIKDTISAISSSSPAASGAARSIIRISGDNTYKLLRNIIISDAPLDRRGVWPCVIEADTEIDIEARVYTFQAPHSYTGEDLAELHFFAPAVLVEKILSRILDNCRLAGPGEFSLRAYLNGKLDLSQAEAVAQIVAGSNKFQLAAAEKLLAGKLCQCIGSIRNQLLDIISLLEAAMDFSEEDIEFITAEDAADRINKVQIRLDEILSGSIRYQELIDIPSVGLAGAANAGKSSLMNALLKKHRSITSDQHGTTRDVLTDVLEMEKSRCAIFDCAGLGEYQTDTQVLDDLAQQAAIDALNAADLVVFCIDISKDDYTQDITILKQINPAETLFVITKCDLVEQSKRWQKIEAIKEIFNAVPIATKVTSDGTVDILRQKIQEILLRQAAGSTEASERIAINQRHRTVLETTMENIKSAADEIKTGNEEVAAMMLRAGYESLAGIEREDIDEQILDRIFSSFCIGK